MSIEQPYPGYATNRLVRIREILDRTVWPREDVRRALAVRDIKTVYRVLQRHGVSQRLIAVFTEQSQSEISEILKDRRVVSYDVLARIADGLGLPRGWMGLAHDNDTLRLVQAWRQETGQQYGSPTSDRN
jgi:plasmid maintenance system antidote protein VapI